MVKLGFIGFGNMAGAIAQGIIQSAFLKPCDCIGYDINDEMMQKMEDMGIERAHNIKEVIDESELILIGVKPQGVETLLNSYREQLEEKAIISIVLGYDFEKYQ